MTQQELTDQVNQIREEARRIWRDMIAQEQAIQAKNNAWISWNKKRRGE